MSDENGTQNSTGRVRFGDAPGNEITPEWAGLVLRELRKTDSGRQQVGNALAVVAARELAGVEVTAKAPSKPKG